MAQAPRDQNHVTAGLGVSDADGVTTIPFYMDSITGYLLVHLGAVASGSSVSNAPVPRDANNVPTMLCTKSDDSGLGAPAIDSSNGYLAFDFIS